MSVSTIADLSAELYLRMAFRSYANRTIEVPRRDILSHRPVDRAHPQAGEKQGGQLLLPGVGKQERVSRSIAEERARAAEWMDSIADQGSSSIET